MMLSVMFCARIKTLYRFICSMRGRLDGEERGIRSSLLAFLRFRRWLGGAIISGLLFGVYGVRHFNETKNNWSRHNIGPRIIVLMEVRMIKRQEKRGKYGKLLGQALR